MDEDNIEDRLGYLLPQHEFFHQGMVLADCESELVRDGSRGLEGGAFFAATLLNRKEAQTSKGKHSMDALKDFYALKSDARFIQYFLHKFDLDPQKDNTPDLMKHASSDKKLEYLHSMVSECLRDLLPFFEKSTLEETSSLLQDHPLQKGKSSSLLASTSSPNISVPDTLDTSSLITNEVAEATAAEIISHEPKESINLVDYLVKTSVTVSSRRTKTVFVCRKCSYESKYETVCLSHIEVCLEDLNREVEDQNVDAEECVLGEDNHDGNGDADREVEENLRLEKEDMYFNYKNGEFFMDAIFAIMTIFERFGDGVGCLIVSKILLPIFHGLNHSNYSSSIHRFVTRILCEANPREGLKLVHERFSNRVGQPGKNIFRDRRMEFRIGITKKLIENLGPNFCDKTVQQVNHMVDVKEDLYIKTRLSHGVSIRSGRHVPRSDETDFLTLVQNLTETKAHLKIKGRRFGDFKLHEDLMNDKRFDRAKFFRWITNKNKEAKEIIEAKNAS